MLVYVEASSFGTVYSNMSADACTDVVEFVLVLSMLLGQMRTILHASIRGLASLYHLGVLGQEPSRIFVSSWHKSLSSYEPSVSPRIPYSVQVL